MSMEVSKKLILRPHNRNEILLELISFLGGVHRYVRSARSCEDGSLSDVHEGSNLIVIGGNATPKRTIDLNPFPSRVSRIAIILIEGVDNGAFDSWYQQI